MARADGVEIVTAADAAWLDGLIAMLSVDVVEVDLSDLYIDEDD